MTRKRVPPGYIFCAEQLRENLLTTATESDGHSMCIARTFSSSGVSRWLLRKRLTQPIGTVFPVVAGKLSVIIFDKSTVFVHEVKYGSQQAVLTL